MSEVPSALRSRFSFHYVALHFVSSGVSRAASYKPDCMRRKALSPVHPGVSVNHYERSRAEVMDWPEAANLCAFLLQEAACSLHPSILLGPP